MNNLLYDFKNTGYKIHLPVVPDVNDPLTRRIIDYLDTKYGIKTNSKKGSSYYKIGSGGDLIDGDGLTLYGRNGSLSEMNELAQEIEQKFGKELDENIRNLNIKPKDPLRLTNSVRARFALYHFGIKTPNNSGGYDFINPFHQYNNKDNPSKTFNIRKFTDINGKGHSTAPGLKGLSDIDKKFVCGDSTLASIDYFGELFTGKIENGKVPQFIMDGLPKEYLQHYNLSEKDIISRINKGTRTIVANMLEDVVNNPNSKILAGNPPWLATLDTQVIDEAKQLLAQYEPQTVQKLEQMLPQLEQKCPALSVLKQTTPFAQMKIAPVQNPVKPVGTNSVNTGNYPVSQLTKPQVNPTNPVNPHTSNPVGTQNPVNPTPKPNTNVGGNSAKVGWFEKLGTKGKVGLAVAGTALVAGTIYALAHHNTHKKNEVATTNALENQLAQSTQSVRTPQNPYNTNFYGYYNNPYYNYSMNGFMSV